MVGCGRGCHLLAQGAVVEYRESLMKQYVMHANATAHTTSLVVPFQGGCSAVFVASREVTKGARKALYPLKTA